MDGTNGSNRWMDLSFGVSVHERGVVDGKGRRSGSLSGSFYSEEPARRVEAVRSFFVPLSTLYFELVVGFSVNVHL